MIRQVLNLLFIVIGLGLRPLLAQTDSLIALWAEFAKDDPNFVERIQELSEHPVNLNTADKDELLSIPLLTPFQADSILALREKLGSFRSKRQIRYILGGQYYELVKALVTIRSRPQKNGIFIHKNYFPVNNRKYEANHFVGSLVYDYNKFYYIFSDRIRIGLITQKDVGEADILDYFSGYAEYKSPSFHILAGSYKLEYGEGLLFSDPFGQQKSSMATLPFRSSISGARPTLSSSENMNQFGLFGGMKIFSLLHWQVFYAGNLRDARLDDKGKIIIGLDYDGYHRTQREIDAAGRVTEQLLGGSLLAEIGAHFALGFMISRLRYTPSLTYTVKTVGLSELRRQFYNFNGEQITAYSIFYNWQWKRLFFSGEYALTNMKSPAYAQTVFLQAENVKVGFKFWHVDKNFQAPYARIFDDNNPFPRANEGMYIGLQYKKQNLQFNFYRLLKKELWRSYFYPMPRQGKEWLAQIDYRFQSAQLMMRYRHKQAETFETDAYDRQIRVNRTQNIYYIQALLRPGKAIRISARWTHTVLFPFTEKGTALYQDILWKITPSIHINFRVTFYRTDSYDSRIYEYETDLPGSFANYALYGQGRKWYVRLRWDMGRYFRLWLKYRYAYLQNPLPRAFNFVNPDKRLDRSLRVELNFKF